MTRDPKVRRVKGGAIVDNLDEYAAAVAGNPPADFNNLLEAAKQLNARACTALGIDADADVSEVAMDKLRDVLLIAAYAYSQDRHQGRGEIPLGFVQRAKQVIEWCKRPVAEMTPLRMLEGQARELARLISSRMFRGDGFILLIFNQGQADDAGNCTWISSAQRRDSIKLLEEMVGKMKEAQGQQS